MIPSHLFLVLFIISSVRCDVIEPTEKQIDPNVFGTSSFYICSLQKISPNLVLSQNAVDLNKSTESSVNQMPFAMKLISTNDNLAGENLIDASKFIESISGGKDVKLVSNQNSSIKDQPNSLVKEEIPVAFERFKESLINNEAYKEIFTNQTNDPKNASTRNENNVQSQSNQNAIKNEEMTTSANFEMREEFVTELNNNEQTDKSSTENKLKEDQKTVTLIDKLIDINKQNGIAATVDPVSNSVSNDNKLRAILPQILSKDSEKESNARQTGFIGSFFNKLSPSSMIGIQDRFDSSVPLVDDDKQLAKSFQASQALDKKTSSGTVESLAKSEGSNENDKQVSTASSTTSTTTSTTTTTTTTAKPTTTLSPEEVEQEKIFKEFFGSGANSNNNVNIILDSIKRRLGFGNKNVPPAVLEQNIQKELATL